jgi:hypothetical protein
MSSSRHPFTEPVRTARGTRALLAELHRRDQLRELQTCQKFVERAVQAWRRQDSPYAATADGMYQALMGELRRMSDDMGGTKSHG